MQKEEESNIHVLLVMHGAAREADKQQVGNIGCLWPQRSLEHHQNALPLVNLTKPRLWHLQVPT